MKRAGNRPFEGKILPLNQPRRQPVVFRATASTTRAETIHNLWAGGPNSISPSEWRSHVDIMAADQVSSNEINCRKLRCAKFSRSFPAPQAFVERPHHQSRPPNEDSKKPPLRPECPTAVIYVPARLTETPLFAKRKRRRKPVNPPTHGPANMHETSPPRPGRSTNIAVDHQQFFLGSSV